MPLHSLAPEILALVLNALACPRDLHSLISASLRCFRAFNLSPERTLAQVLANSISPEAYYDALAIAHLPAGPFADDAETSEALSLHTDQYLDGDIPETFPVGADSAETLVSMCRLHRQVLRLSRDFAEQAFRLIDASHGASSATPTTLEPWQPVSKAESARFERAFFRYELYCRLHPRDSEGGIDSLVSGEEQFIRFVRHLLPWEAEELLSVHHYLCRRVEKYISEIDNELYEAVLFTPGAHFPPDFTPKPVHRDIENGATSPADNDPTPPRTASRDIDHVATSPAESDDNPPREIYWDFDFLDNRGLVLFAREENYHYYNQWTSYIVAEGLDLMSQLAAANKADRRQLIRNFTAWSREFLFEALNYRADDPPEPLPLRLRIWSAEDDACDSSSGTEHGDGRGRDDDWKSGTHGFQLLSIRDPIDFPPVHEMECDDPGGPLRDMAFCFWGTERVEIPWVLAALRRAQGLSDADVKAMYERERGESAQKRLKGVEVPRAEFYRIQREFMWQVFVHNGPPDISSSEEEEE